MKRKAMVILCVICLCAACTAQAAGSGLPAFTSVRDALDSTEGYAVIRDNEEYIVLILEADGRYFRVVTFLDSRAKELYRAAMADYSTAAMEAFDEYAWSLPAGSVRELPEAPLGQAELDGFIGKKLRELMDMGFGRELILSGDPSEPPAAVSLEYGLYRYEFEVTEGASGDPELMAVLGAKFDGVSSAAFEIAGPEEYSGER